jgi:hypothetical protein
VASARKRYVHAAGELAKSVGKVADLVYDDAEVARIAYVAARKSRDAHVKEHGC